MPATLLPSAPALAVAWLKGNPALVALHGGRVGTRLNATLPAVRVQRIGGTPPDTYEDQPILQVECWAVDEGTADLLVRTVVAELPSARGVYPAGHLWSYVVESGPFWAPDDPQLSNNSRYIITVRLLTSP